MPIDARDKFGRFAKGINTWTIDGNISYCYSGETLLFFTNADLYETLRSMTFSKLANGYSAVRISGKSVPVHRLISNPSPGEVVDHINQNKKDNRRENLRNTNKSVNAFNAKIRTTNTSGITGVRCRKDTNRWTAEIKKNYVKIALGCFETKEEAIAARKKAEDIIYGY